MAEEFSDRAAQLRARAVEAQKRYAQTEQSLLDRARSLVAQQ